MSRYVPVVPVSLGWSDNTPRCRNYDDIYFSNEGGIAETQYVFLSGNNLPERWQNSSDFTIAETGFGTGLNFLCTLEQWLPTAAEDTRLNYISVEQHPLTSADLEKALSTWSSLAELGSELLEHYPPLVHGLHQRRLLNGRVTLTLLFGDAAAMFSEIDARVDAWYLDGFAPSKNPEMWTPDLFKQIACLSKPGSSFATFSAAGAVKRGMREVGFEVSTRPGFGRKRDMLAGKLITPANTPHPQPWFHYPPINVSQKRAVVIGAGLAGCTVSHTLAQQGWQITLIERHAGVAQEASGNHAGVVMPRLTADMSAAGQFYLSAFLHTVHWLNQLKQRDPALPWFQSGVVQLCDERQQQRLHKLGLPKGVLEICDTAAASEYCGTTTKRGGLYYPSAGWLDPPAFCQWLINDQKDRINTLLLRDVLSLKRENDQWSIMAGDGEVTRAETVIIANGYDAEYLLDSDIYMLQKVRGQLAYLPSDPHTEILKTPVCYDGYITPCYKGKHCVGASYDIGDSSTELNNECETQVLTALRDELPEFGATSENSGRVAFRTTTQDHLPLIGAIPDISFYQKEYADLHHGKPGELYDKAQYLANLFISCGHGSRGLVSAPLAAATIGSLLNNKTSPLMRDLFTATHTARFFIRKTKRGGH